MKYEIFFFLGENQKVAIVAYRVREIVVIIYYILCIMLSCSVLPDSVTPWAEPAMLLCPCGFSVHGDSGVGCHALLQGDLPNPGIEPRSPSLKADSLLSEPPGKPKNTGVGSLSLLQGTFSTQESNWGLLHYRWILYQLSYKGNPYQSLDQ